jgi:helix-turn-helix protein
VKETVIHSQRAQTRSRVAQDRDKATRVVSRFRRARRALAECSDRLAMTPFESGVVLGKSATYIYRQIYAGKIKPISDCGRMMIPRSEIDRFLARACEYNPKPKPRANQEEPRAAVVSGA